MPKKPPHFIFLIAIEQRDGTDHIYQVLAKSVDEAIEVAAAQEPGCALPRHVGGLRAAAVKRLKMKAGEAQRV